MAKQEFKEKYGTIEMKIETEPRESHMENFLRCVRTRETPVLDADTAYRGDGAHRHGRAVVPRGPRALLRRSRREGRRHAAEDVRVYFEFFLRISSRRRFRYSSYSFLSSGSRGVP